MSHVVSIKTEITDIEAVKRVCAELGLTFKENQKTYQWFGEYMGDSPLPEGFTKDQLGKCEHAIGVPGTSWEIGLGRPKTGNGLRLLFDYFGGYGRPILAAVGGQTAPLFCQKYAVCKTEIEAAKKGWLTRRVQVGPKVQVHVTGM